MKHFAYLLLSVLILSSCAKTNMTTQVYFDNDENRIANLYVIVNDTNHARYFEHELSKELHKKGRNIYINSNYFSSFPSEYQLGEIMARYDIDGVLIINLNNSEHSFYVPETYHAGSSTTNIYAYGNYATAYTTHTPSYTTGGYSYDVSAVDCYASLFTNEGILILNTSSGYEKEYRKLIINLAHELDSSKVLN